MSTHLPSIDISTMKLSDLVRLVEEVGATKQPRLLKRDNEPVAMLMPVGTTVKLEKKPEKTKADYKACCGAEGSWKDVDTDNRLRNIYDDRRRTNTRPSVKL